MLSSRKIQLECDLLNRYFNSKDNMDIEHEGVIFDKEGCDGKYTYMVYLEKIKLLSKIKTNVNIDNYSKQRFKIYLFEDEDKIRKKIRLQITV